MTEQLQVDLSAHYNNDAFSSAENTADGAINVWRNTLPAEDVPPGPVLQVADLLFTRPPTADGALNDVVCDGQFIPVPEGDYDWIYVMVAGERRSEDFVYLHFADSSVDPEWLRVSDFWPGPSRFGEPAAISFSALHYERHVQRNLRPTIWLQRIPVTRQQRLIGFRLPENRSMHLFAATLIAAPNRTLEGKRRAEPRVG